MAALNQALATVSGIRSFDERFVKLYTTYMSLLTQNKTVEAQAYADAMIATKLQRQIQSAQEQGKYEFKHPDFDSLSEAAVSGAKSLYDTRQAETADKRATDAAAAKEVKEAAAAQQKAAKLANRTPLEQALDSQGASAETRAIIKQEYTDKQGGAHPVSLHEAMVAIKVRTNSSDNWFDDPAVKVLQNAEMIAKDKGLGINDRPAVTQPEQQDALSLIGSAHAAKPKPASKAPPASGFIDQALNEIIGTNGPGLMNPKRHDHDAIRQQVTKIVHDHAGILDAKQTERDALYVQLQQQNQQGNGSTAGMASGYTVDVIERAVELEKAHGKGQKLAPLTRESFVEKDKDYVAYATDPAAWRAAHEGKAAQGADASGAAADGASGSTASGGIKLWKRKDGTPAPNPDEVPHLTDEAQVRALQEKLGVTVDGKYGPETHKAMMEAAQRQGKPAHDFDFTAQGIFDAFIAALTGSASGTAQTPADQAVAPASDLKTLADKSLVGTSTEDLDVRTTQAFKDKLTEMGVSETVARAFPNQVSQNIQDETISQLSTKLKAEGVTDDKIQEIAANIKVDANGHITGSFIQNLEKLEGRSNANPVYDMVDASLLDDKTPIGQQGIKLIAAAIKSGQLGV